MKRSVHSMTTKLRICLVSDFFFPNFGGVETHIWCLAQCLLQRGHKVIVVTHRYKSRCGVRTMANGLKVYYLPLTVVHDQVILPSLFSFLPLFRNILARECIQIVHAHQSVSVMAHEALWFAKCLGYKTVFTDHSLFGFDDVSSTHINKLLEITLSGVDHCICVSHACRENLALRARLHPFHISAVPNAVDATLFTPSVTSQSLLKLPNDKRNLSVTVVVLSRLVFRKGIDLLAEVVPQVCQRLPHVRFLIGGDGPKRLLLEEMREKYQLYDRVELLGSVSHSEVKEILCRGQVFLNCSLTESFCIALLEAAACGLFVVSTDVGGVPEVLPPAMIQLVTAETQAIVDGVCRGVSLCRAKFLDPQELHETVMHMYSWPDVTRRMENIYLHVSSLKKTGLYDRLCRVASVSGHRFTIGGVAISCVVVFVALCLELCSALLDFIFPSSEIEPAPENALFVQLTPDIRK